jgi:hypothetical protein
MRRRRATMIFEAYCDLIHSSALPVAYVVLLCQSTTQREILAQQRLDLLRLI